MPCFACRHFPQYFQPHQQAFPSAAYFAQFPCNPQQQPFVPVDASSSNLSSNLGDLHSGLHQRAKTASYHSNLKHSPTGQPATIMPQFLPPQVFRRPTTSPSLATTSTSMGAPRHPSSPPVPKSRARTDSKSVPMTADGVEISLVTGRPKRPRRKFEEVERDYGELRVFFVAHNLAF